jgi:hypothetical protein
MIRADRIGISRREETISELLWVNAQPFVMCADFTHDEGKAVGADWLWWWVDGSGECLGMLAQAKRLHHQRAAAVGFQAQRRAAVTDIAIWRSCGSAP